MQFLQLIYIILKLILNSFELFGGKYSTVDPPWEQQPRDPSRKSGSKSRKNGKIVRRDSGKLVPRSSNRVEYFSPNMMIDKMKGKKE